VQRDHLARSSLVLLASLQLLALASSIYDTCLTEANADRITADRDRSDNHEASMPSGEVQRSLSITEQNAFPQSAMS
jgi:hypothetical protein